ncbi:hypothetical protein FHW84_001837 [Dyella sp. SG562]|uniref:Gp138 family membrane-puncturing spike protein n=1 Tax=Dyella sp. SG562 TaxID=2587017 RepID=UPI00141E7641|nr:hypothetical protein [Dyella sp. SG562]
MIENTQRTDDSEEVYRLSFKSFMVKAWTGMPGYIVDFNPSTVTATVQIGVRGVVATSDGSSNTVPYPLLKDVPVQFPGTADSVLTFPVQPGDECWVAFSNRAIGAWIQSGGLQDPSDARGLDLRNAICVLGGLSQPKVIPEFNNDHTQLRSRDGSTYVELDSAGGILKFVAPGGFQFQGPSANFSGTVTAAETITSTGGDVLAGSISLQHHVHPDVQSGSSTTGQPE